jgi:hypothetical protein
MKYSNDSFTVGANSSEAKKNFDQNYDSIFRKKCMKCGEPSGRFLYCKKCLRNYRLAEAQQGK